MKKEKLLIINADDYGNSIEANDAITELLLNHNISSASLMPNGLYYKEALHEIKTNDFKNIGIHITVTNDNFAVEKPLKMRSITHQNSLEDEQGYLYSGVNSFLSKYNREELLLEVQSQLLKLLGDEIDFTHIDNHMYSIFPTMGRDGFDLLFEAYSKIAEKKHRGIRIARKLLESDGFYSIWAGRKLKPYLWFKMKKLGLIGPDYAYLFSYNAKKFPTLELKKQYLDHFFRNVPNGITELHFHPCKYSYDLSQQNPTWTHRVQEYELLKEINPDMLMSEYGIKLTSYKDLL